MKHQLCLCIVDGMAICSELVYDDVLSDASDMLIEGAVICIIVFIFVVLKYVGTVVVCDRTIGDHIVKAYSGIDPVRTL